nr:cupin domain-containing protein [Rhodoferax ferrireducens]
MHAFLHSVQTADFHLHAAFEVLLVLCGRVMLYTDAGEQRLEAGDLAIIHGNQPHATHDLGEANAVLALHIDPAITRHDAHFSRRRFDLGELRADAEKSAVRRQLRGLVARIMIESRVKRSAWELEVESLVLRLVAMLLRKVPSVLVDEARACSIRVWPALPSTSDAMPASLCRSLPSRRHMACPAATCRVCSSPRLGRASIASSGTYACAARWTCCPGQNLSPSPTLRWTVGSLT